MTLTLIVMRHAKSDWDDPGLDDHDRPLNRRGRKDAPRIGRWLAEQDLLPEHALCSTATRARETLAGAAPDTPADFLSDLYMASPRVLLRTVQAAPPKRLIVIAHNPGIGAFAAGLLAAPPDHPRFAQYPTAATLIADFDIDQWSALEPGTGRLRAFVTPHDLPQ